MVLAGVVGCGLSIVRLHRSQLTWLTRRKRAKGHAGRPSKSTGYVHSLHIGGLSVSYTQHRNGSTKSAAVCICNLAPRWRNQFARGVSELCGLLPVCPSLRGTRAFRLLVHAQTVHPFQLRKRWQGEFPHSNL